MKRKFYKTVHKMANLLCIERLVEWSYIKWLKSYMSGSGDPNANFWAFTEDYLATMGGKN